MFCNLSLTHLLLDIGSMDDYCLFLGHISPYGIYRCSQRKKLTNGL